MTKRHRFAAAAMFAALVSTALLLQSGRPAFAETAMILPVDPAPLVAETDVGEKRFTIEVADDPSEREKGLMFRENMADNHGMLFVFENTRPVSFWMHNTPMPLDLVFVSESGAIEAILPGEPFSDAVISPGEPVRFVLELKRGTAASMGLESGDVLRHPKIEAAGNAG